VVETLRKLSKRIEELVGKEKRLLPAAEGERPDKSLVDPMKEKKKGGENKKRGVGDSAAGSGKKRGGAGQKAKKQKTQQATQGGGAACGLVLAAAQANF
jgi:hypothetical protein